MKNLFLTLILTLPIVIFNSCQDDESIILENELTSETSVEFLEKAASGINTITEGVDFINIEKLAESMIEGFEIRTRIFKLW